MQTLTMPKAALARLFLLAGLGISVSATAYAGDLGSCSGVDFVEADLKQSSSSGYFIPGLRLIVLNRTLLNTYALPVQKFIFEHECAHSDPAVAEDEDAADCAAAKRGRKQGWLGNSEIIQVCVHLSRMPVDATHKPVYFRCTNIRRCASEAEGKDQVASHTESETVTLLPSDILRR